MSTYRNLPPPYIKGNLTHPSSSLILPKVFGDEVISLELQPLTRTIPSIWTFPSSLLKFHPSCYILTRPVSDSELKFVFSQVIYRNLPSPVNFWGLPVRIGVFLLKIWPVLSEFDPPCHILTRPVRPERHFFELITHVDYGSSPRYPSSEKKRIQLKNLSILI